MEKVIQMPKKKLYSSDSCHYCADAKKKLSSEIALGQIEIVDVDSDPKARETALKYGGTPTLTVTEGDTECEIDIDTGKKLKCIPKGE